MVEEVVLQLLVAEVDTELLERVELEHLEAEDVKDPNDAVARRRARHERAVRVVDQKVEELAVDTLAPRVARRERVLRVAL